jgi:hypothetical protein
MAEESFQIKETRSRYRLGKVTNKYLIIEIYSYAYLTREEAMYRMFIHGRSSRDLLIEQYKALPKLIPHQLETIRLKYSQNLEPFHFTITKSNQLNNHFKLEITISILKDLQPILDILVPRHNDKAAITNHAYITDNIDF